MSAANFDSAIKSKSKLFLFSLWIGVWVSGLFWASTIFFFPPFLSCFDFGFVHSKFDMSSQGNFGGCFRGALFLVRHFFRFCPAPSVLSVFFFKLFFSNGTGGVFPLGCFDHCWDHGCPQRSGSWWLLIFSCTNFPNEKLRLWYYHQVHSSQDPEGTAGALTRTSRFCLTIKKTLVYRMTRNAPW